MLDQPTLDAIGALAARLKCSNAALLAKIESAGTVFAMVDHAESR